MNDPRITASMPSRPIRRGGPTLSFLSLLGLECKLSLMEWANSVKYRLVAAREVELELERQNQRLAGGTLWPPSIAGGSRPCQNGPSDSMTRSSRAPGAPGDTR